MSRFPVAQEILSQLGGQQFKAMTGANNFGATDNSMSCKIMPNQTGANYVIIKLNALDYYDIEFVSVRAGKRKVKESYQNIDCEQLRGIFEDATGLRTSLSHIYGTEKH